MLLSLVSLEKASLVVAAVPFLLFSLSIEHLSVGSCLVWKVRRQKVCKATAASAHDDDDSALGPPPLVLAMAPFQLVTHRHVAARAIHAVCFELD